MSFFLLFGDTKIWNSVEVYNPERDSLCSALKFPTNLHRSAASTVSDHLEALNNCPSHVFGLLVGLNEHYKSAVDVNGLSQHGNWAFPGIMRSYRVLGILEGKYF